MTTQAQTMGEAMLSMMNVSDDIRATAERKGQHGKGCRLFARDLLLINYKITLPTVAQMYIARIEKMRGYCNN